MTLEAGVWPCFCTTVSDATPTPPRREGGIACCCLVVSDSVPTPSDDIVAGITPTVKLHSQQFPSKMHIIRCLSKILLWRCLSKIHSRSCRGELHYQIYHFLARASVHTLVFQSLFLLSLLLTFCLSPLEFLSLSDHHVSPTSPSMILLIFARCARIIIPIISLSLVYTK